MTTQGNVRQGQIEVYVPRMIGYLANQVSSPTAALEEYLDNGRDAGANLLIVSIHPDHVVIFDNGHGMVHEMAQEPYNLLQDYKAQVKAGREPEVDVREVLPRVAGCSYQWLMECIGFSQKRPVKGERVTGMRGIGMLAFSLIGNSIEWRSRPSHDLAFDFWGVGSAQAANPPIAILHPPSAENLARGQFGYSVEVTRQTVLNDPTGHRHESGTVITITDLTKDFLETVRPAAIADDFRRRYGSDIREGTLKVLVIDHVTNEGKRAKSGKVIEVQPLSYKGVKVLDRAGSIPGIQGSEFRAEFYYDANSKNSNVSWRRMGTNVDGVITAVRDLDVPPFNTRKLSGYVDLPDVPEDVFPLNPAKTQPRSSSALRNFAKVILSWRLEIEEAINKSEARARDAGNQQLMKDFSSLTEKALSEMPEIRNLVQVAGSSGVIDRRGTTVTKDIYGIAQDEYGDPVTGIRILLLKGRQTLKSVETGPGGSAFFGRWDPDNYTLRIELPDGMTMRHGLPDSIPFTTTVDQPGIRWIFRLVTGKDEPERKTREGKKIQGRITIIQRQLPDVDQPYSIEQLMRGQIWINTEAEEFRRADEADDAELKAQIVAVCTANAIVDYTMADFEPVERSRTSTILTTKLLRLRKGLIKR